MGKYLIKGSILRCDKGEKESKFNPDKKTVSVQGKPVGTTKDCKAGVHVKDFKGCALAGECKLATELMGKNLKWEKFRERTTIEGHNVITDESICRCPIGGTISVVDSTQVEGSAEKNALLEQIEDVMSQAIQKVTNDMIAIRNDLGYGNKKLGISEKMKIYRTFEKQNPYYKNFENLFGREQKSIMQEKVLDEVLYQVRTEEGYTWMTKRDTLLFVLILFMLFNVLDSENVLMLPVMFGVVEIVGGVGIGAAGGSGALASALAGGAAGILLAVVVIVVVKSLSKNNESVESSNASENVGDISLGSTGYVQGVDLSLEGIGVESYQESFDLIDFNPPVVEGILEDMENQKLEILKARIGNALKQGNVVLAQSLVDELDKKLENKSFETYVKYGKYGTPFEDMIYFGKTSGKYKNLNSPASHVKTRNKKHRIDKPDFMDSILDKSTHFTGNLNEQPNPLVLIPKELSTYTIGNKSVTFSKRVMDSFAINGREQILIEKFGGLGHPKLENKINGVSRDTPVYDISKRLARLYYGDDPEEWILPNKPVQGSDKKTWITVKDLKEKMRIK
ncbi:DUF4280 domain-containing protein [Leptotrichia massiliensis]